MKTLSVASIEVESKARKNGDKHYIVFAKTDWLNLTSYFKSTSPSQIRDKILFQVKHNAQLAIKE